MEHQVHVGDIVDVTITGIQPYGAFARDFDSCRASDFKKR